MRGFLVLAIVALAGSAAAAAPAEIPALEPSRLPARCRTAALVPDDARTMRPVLDADIAAASCAAQARLAAIHVEPTAPCIKQLAEAIRPSMAVLEAVVSAGDPVHRAIAKHAEADLFEGVAIRILSSVPPLPPLATPAQRHAHDEVLARADLLARSWRARAVHAYDEVRRLAEDLPPEALQDPVIGFTLGDSRFEQVHGVARR